MLCIVATQLIASWIKAEALMGLLRKSLGTWMVIESLTAWFLLSIQVLSAK